MDPNVFMAIIILALLFSLIYTIRSLHYKKDIKTDVFISLVLRSGGLILGGILVLSPIIVKLESYVTNTDLYTAIGGFGVIALSLQGIRKDVFFS